MSQLAGSVDGVCGTGPGVVYGTWGTLLDLVPHFLKGKGAPTYDFASPYRTAMFDDEVAAKLAKPDLNQIIFGPERWAVQAIGKPDPSEREQRAIAIALGFLANTPPEVQVSQVETLLDDLRTSLSPEEVRQHTSHPKHGTGIGLDHDQVHFDDPNLDVPYNSQNRLALLGEPAASMVSLPTKRLGAGAFGQPSFAPFLTRFWADLEAAGRELTPGRIHHFGDGTAELGLPGALVASKYRATLQQIRREIGTLPPNLLLAVAKALGIEPLSLRGNVELIQYLEPRQVGARSLVSVTGPDSQTRQIVVPRDAIGQSPLDVDRADVGRFPSVPAEVLVVDLVDDLAALPLDELVRSLRSMSGVRSSGSMWRQVQVPAPVGVKTSRFDSGHALYEVTPTSTTGRARPAPTGTRRVVEQALRDGVNASFILMPAGILKRAGGNEWPLLVANLLGKHRGTEMPLVLIAESELDSTLRAQAGALGVPVVTKALGKASQQLVALADEWEVSVGTEPQPLGTRLTVETLRTAADQFQRRPSSSGGSEQAEFLTLEPARLRPFVAENQGALRPQRAALAELGATVLGPWAKRLNGLPTVTPEQVIGLPAAAELTERGALLGLDEPYQEIAATFLAETDLSARWHILLTQLAPFVDRAVLADLTAGDGTLQYLALIVSDILRGEGDLEQRMRIAMNTFRQGERWFRDRTFKQAASSAVMKLWSFVDQAEWTRDEAGAYKAKFYEMNESILTC